MLPANHIVQGILWELYHLNFTYELLSLDRRSCCDLDTTDDVQLMQRQAMILEFFSADPFLLRSLPDRNCGLAANEIEECLLFILPLIHVMQSWKGDRPTIFSLAARSYQEIPGSEAPGLEEAATKYYCQQFFNYFGHAALVPHRLFMPLINLLDSCKYSAGLFLLKIYLLMVLCIWAHHMVNIYTKILIPLY